MKDEQKVWKRNCPQCKIEVLYHQYSCFYRANKENRLCLKCIYKNKNIKALEECIYVCPKCKDEIQFKSRGAALYNKRNKLACWKCKKKRYSGDFIKKCPNCGKEIIYKNYSGYQESKNKNKICKSCSSIGQIVSNETRQKISKNRKGKLVGQNNPFYGKTHSPESKKKMRLSRISYLNKIVESGGQISPNYNINACKIIDEYGKENGYNFQHAMNGGEFYIKELGYWVDGYDKDKNAVIEYYEIGHNKPKNIIRDIHREKEITDLLKCRFIIIHEN